MGTHNWNVKKKEKKINLHLHFFICSVTLLFTLSVIHWTLWVIYPHKKQLLRIYFACVNKYSHTEKFLVKQPHLRKVLLFFSFLVLHVHEILQKCHCFTLIKQVTLAPNRCFSTGCLITDFTVVYVRKNQKPQN